MSEAHDHFLMVVQVDQREPRWGFKKKIPSSACFGFDPLRDDCSFRVQGKGQI